MPISMRDISSENMATGSPCTAMLRAMFMARELLPMPGRAAMTTRLPGCSPDIRLSRSTNPVGRPVNAESRFWIDSRSTMAWLTSSRRIATSS